MKDVAFKLICKQCKKEYELFPKTYTCRDCGGQLIYDVSLEKESIKEIFRKISSSTHKNLWTYKDLLPPIDKQYIISLGEGGTPLIEAVNLAKQVGIKNLFLKDESRNPTQSFRDRAATVITSVAKMLGVRKVICASNGNMAASLAAYGSKAHLNVTVILPENVELGKLAQVHMYGSKVITFGKTVDDAIEYEISNFSFETYYHATPELNPLALEGQKTIAFELVDQLNTLDFIVIPTGSGSLAYSIWLGLKILKDADILQNIPRLVIVQPDSCAPIVWQLKNKEFKSESIKLITGIFVKNPKYIEEVVAAVKSTNGVGIAIPEEEIIEMEKKVAKYEGIFAEPSSATSIAGIQHLVSDGVIDKKDNVVAILTSSGLKTPYIIRALTQRKKTAVISKTLNTKIKILKFLEYGPSYGYEIWKQLFPTLKIQAVYQHLTELEDRGLIRASTKDRRKYFEITDKGKKVVKAFDELALLL